MKLCPVFVDKCTEMETVGQSWDMTPGVILKFDVDDIILSGVDNVGKIINDKAHTEFKTMLCEDNILYKNRVFILNRLCSFGLVCEDYLLGINRSYKITVLGQLFFKLIDEKHIENKDS